MTRLPLILLIALFPSVAIADDAISFRKEIAPILLKSCQGCHGARETKSKYRLDTFAHLLKPGASDEPAITPGKPEDSELYRLLIAADKTERMPFKGDPLPKEQIALVKKWIQQGGRYDAEDVNLSLAQILPVTIHPPAPETYRPIPVTAIAFAADGQQVAVGGYHEVTIWNAADGALVRRIGNVTQRTYGLAFSHDGQFLAVAGGAPGEMGEVRLINFADGSLKRVLVSSSDVFFDVKFSPDGKTLATGGADGLIRLFDVQSLEPTLTISNHSDWVCAIAFSPDSTKLASASRDRTAKAFDLAKGGEMIAGYMDHNDQVYAVAFHPDGDKVYSAGRDRRIMLWNLSDSKRTGEMGTGGEAYELALDGENLLACSSDNNARLFNAKDRKQLKQFSGHKDFIYAVALNMNAKRAATGSHDGQVRIWNTEDGKEVQSFFAAPGFKATP